MSEKLLQQVLAQREAWVDLAPGKRVRVRRPPEAEFYGFRHATPVDAAARHVVGWDGFVESDLLGAGVGGSSPVPFEPELWAVLVADRIDWIEKVFEHLAKAIGEHLKAREAAGKN